MVVLNHVAWKLQQRGSHLLDWFDIGEAGVDIFFVISGFIMCHVTAGRRPGVGAFVRDRLARILPLYWILTSVALGVFLLAPGRVNSSGGATHILASYLLVPVEGKFLVQAGWTLSYELYFYLLFAAGLLARGRKGMAMVAAALLSLAGLGAWVPSSHHGLGFLTNDLLLEFACGIGLYALYERQVVRRGWIAILIAAAGAALFVAVNRSPDHHVLSAIRAIRYGVPAFLVCAGLVFLERPIARHRIAWLMLLGDSSYSLYLSHVFTIAALAMVLERVGAGGRWVDAAAALLMLAAPVFAAILCYRWLERPLRVALKGRFRARAAAAPAA